MENVMKTLFALRLIYWMQNDHQHLAEIERNIETTSNLKGITQ